MVDSKSPVVVEIPKRRRVAISAGITLYVGLLLYGVLIHTFNLPAKPTLGGYFIVWDMFCGWSGYERRYHFIAEGVSGTYYDASEVPGRVVKLHGSTPRRHHDHQGIFAGELVKSVLARTDHEPILRVYVVEENWPKRFNLPPSLRPEGLRKEKVSYWHTRGVLNEFGDPIRHFPSWFTVQADAAVYCNPILRSAASRKTTSIAHTR